jgi:tetratricopeptide (TPR) repeat protein
MTGYILGEEYYWNTARCWMNLDNYKKAIRCLEKSIKIYDVSYVRFYLA